MTLIRTKHLNFICTRDSFHGAKDASIVPFDADTDYALLTAFFDSCPDWHPEIQR